MAKPVHNPNHPFFFFFFFFLFLFISLLSIPDSEQLQLSQSQALLKIQQQLNYPQVLSSWNQTTDFCNTDPNPSLTLVCYEDNITQLHINGETLVNQSFSSVSFFSNLVALPTLKVLSLVSMGLWGQLPPSIEGLSSLEILNLSSNCFSGSIPQEVSSLRSLQTLILDHNRFTGQVPTWVSSLPLLTVLSFNNNSLTGYLPNSMTSLESLRILSLSMNQLSGEVPNLQNLRNLQVLDLGDNEFGPHFPSLPTKLVIIVLRKNRFRFGIPEELSTSYYQLQKLDVSLNGFGGPFLLSLLSLPSLSYLDISGNKFTGMLSGNTSCNGGLGYVNLSSNRLTGELPTCLQPNSSTRVVQYAGNCLSQPRRGREQHPDSFCHSEALAVKIMPRKRERKPFRREVLASSLLGGIALCVVVFLGFRTVYTKQISFKKPQPRLILEKVSSSAYTMKLLSDARYISDTMKLGALGLPPYRTFVLGELREATSNFSTLNVIGEGSQGKVYKGTLMDGTVVAIRSLKMLKRHGVQSYTHQIELISKLRHRHLVSAIGHCFECYPDDSTVRTIFLVFELVPNGTLRGYISEGLSGQKFTWTQRITAAIGIAKGIQFLHTGTVPGVFSNDLKITNVLLDHDLHVKISNYNLPLLAEKRSLVVTGAFATELKEQNRVTTHEDKNDVYDMGVILLEIILGRTIMSQSDISITKDLLQVSLTADDVARKSIVDPSIQKECSNESLKSIMEICVGCLCNEPKDRPSVEDVLWNLQFAAQIQGLWTVDSKSSQGSPIMPPK